MKTNVRFIHKSIENSIEVDVFLCKDNSLPVKKNKKSCLSKYFKNDSCGRF